MLAFNEFGTRDEAAALLARGVSERLRRAAEERAAASMVVSGGTSPAGFFQALRLLPLPWYLVTVVPSDERWVPVDDAASNEGMIRRELLSGEPACARFVSLYRTGQSAIDALPALEAALAAVPRPFDAVVLGMGDDGHTASLFPDSPDIGTALRSDAACIVQYVPRLGVPRISLTLRSLLDTQELDLLFFGAVKRAVYEQALQPGPIEQYPVRALLHQARVPVNVYWAP
jgi:6-phosphogluconolactonase